MRYKDKSLTYAWSANAPALSANKARTTAVNGNIFASVTQSVSATVNDFGISNCRNLLSSSLKTAEAKECDTIYIHVGVLVHNKIHMP